MPTHIGEVVEVQWIGSWQLRSSSAHCDQELARRREEKEQEKRSCGELCKNLTTLTWQVGNHKTKQNFHKFSEKIRQFYGKKSNHIKSKNVLSEKS